MKYLLYVYFYGVCSVFGQEYILTPEVKEMEFAYSNDVNEEFVSVSREIKTTVPGRQSNAWLNLGTFHFGYVHRLEIKTEGPFSGTAAIVEFVTEYDHFSPTPIILRYQQLNRVHGIDLHYYSPKVANGRDGGGNSYNNYTGLFLRYENRGVAANNVKVVHTVTSRISDRLYTNTIPEDEAQNGAPLPTWRSEDWSYAEGFTPSEYSSQIGNIISTLIKQGDDYGNFVEGDFETHSRATRYTATLGRSPGAYFKNHVEITQDLRVGGQLTDLDGNPIYDFSGQFIPADTNQISLGVGSSATGINSLAIGSDARAEADNSLAIGANAVTSDDVKLAVKGDTRLDNLDAQDIEANNLVLDSELNANQITVGEMLKVDGDTELKGIITITQPQGDISMGLFAPE